MLTILPSLPQSRAVFFRVSNNRFVKRNPPKWLTANCCSIPSFDRVNGGAMIPALLLHKAKNQNKKQIQILTFRKKFAKIQKQFIVNEFELRVVSYTSMFSGRPVAMKAAANFLMEANVLRSISMTSILAPGIFLMMSSLTFSPALQFLTPMIT